MDAHTPSYVYARTQANASFSLPIDSVDAIREIVLVA